MKINSRDKNQLTTFSATRKINDEAFRRGREAECIPSLRVTPAMEAGTANHIWKLEELVNA